MSTIDSYYKRLQWREKRKALFERKKVREEEYYQLKLNELCERTKRFGLTDEQKKRQREYARKRYHRKMKDPEYRAKRNAYYREYNRKRREKELKNKNKKGVEKI